MRRIRYQEIADELRQQITAGEYGSGQVLPSESTLGAVHDASRVTIRKALERLRDEGLVESRQGFGWLVATEALPQALAGLKTIDEQLAASGRRSERRVLDFRYVDAPAEVADTLGPRVLEVRRLNLADGEPFARVTVWCREDLAAPLSRADVERSSFLRLLDERPAQATQAIGARGVDPDDAQLLGLPPTAAVLVVRRVTQSAAGRAILVSEHVFPGHLTELVVTLPWADEHEDAAPRGLRLVDDQGGDDGALNRANRANQAHRAEGTSSAG
ncbi:MAG: GntR family transcriptional regulator [Actinomycetota bacterium]